MADETTTPDMANTPDPNSYDSSISNTPETGGEETPELEGPGFSLDENTDIFGGNHVFGMATGVVEKGSVSGEHLKDLEGYTTRMTDMDQAFMDAAITQGPWAAIGNGLARAGTEVVGGTLEGFGALAALLDDERMEHENWLEELGRGIRESTDDLDIWERNRGGTFEFTDAAWWAKNLPSMASTLSMMIPAGAVARGVGLLGKAARASKIAKTVKGAKMVAKGEQALKSVAGGMTMRHAENMREAHGTFEEARNEFLKNVMPLDSFKGTDAWQAFVRDNNRRPANKYELADYIGGAAAKKSYQFNSINLMFDIAQFHGFGKMLKATRGAGGAAAKAAAAGKELTRGARWANRLSKVTPLAMEMGSEGIEEMINHMGNKEGLYHAMRLAGQGEESTFDERMKMYMNDDHMWEAAFFGAIGGGVFTGARAAMDRIQGKGTKQQERILEQVRHRQQLAADARDIAKQVENGEISADEGRAKVAHQQMGAAVSAAQSGTMDLMEQQLEEALAQMQKEGVSKEQREQFENDTREAMRIAEEAVTEANTLVASMPDLTPEARTLLTHSLASIAQDQHMNQTHQTALQGRIGEMKNFEEQRAALIREALADTEVLLKKADKNHPDYAKLVEENKHLKALAEELGEPTMVVDEAQVEKLTSKLEELKSKDTTSMEEAGKRAIVKQIEETTKALEEAKAGTPVKYEENALVEEFVGTELTGMKLTGMKADLLSADGIEGLKTAAKEMKEAMDKKEAEERSKGSEEATDEQLMAERKRLDENEDADRIKEIDEILNQRKLERENNEASKNEQRSKDIEVGAAAQAAIDKLITDTENLELVDESGNPADGNGKYYRDKRTGKLYMRTTTFIHNGKSKDIPNHWGRPASNIGNSVDLFVRDYFDGNIGAHEYPHLPAELRAELITQLEELERKFVANGEKVVPHDVTLMTDHNAATEMDERVSGIAGTVDLLTVDAKGNLRVYDMKTVREAVAVKQIWVNNKPTNQVGSKIGTKTNLTTGEVQGQWGKRMSKEQAEGYQKQVSTYAIMAEMSTGLPVVAAGIIPIDVRYDSNKNLTNEELDQIVAGAATLLPTIPQELIPEINGLKVEEQTLPNEDQTDGLDENGDINDADLSNTLLHLEQTRDNVWEQIRSYKRTLDTFDKMGFKEDNPKRITVEEKLKAAQDEYAALTAKIEEIKANQPDSTPDEGHDGPDDFSETFTLATDLAALEAQLEDVKATIAYIKERIASTDDGAAQVRLESALENFEIRKEVIEEAIENVSKPDDTDGTDDITTETVDGADFSMPVSHLVNYFGQKLEVMTDWNRDNILVHGHDGAVVVSDKATEDQVRAITNALRPNSDAVIRFRVVGNVARDQVGFKSFLKKGDVIGKVRGMEGVAEGEKKGRFTYTPGLSDSMEIVMEIDGVAMGTVPSVGQLLQASSDRFDAVSRKDRADARFGTDTRTGTVRMNENLLMSEATQEAHLENAIAIHELRLMLLEKGALKNAEGVVLRMEATPGKTNFGQRAVGSPILDRSRTVTVSDVSTEAHDLLIEDGVALALPGSDGKTQQVQQSGSEKNLVTPYGQNESAGATVTSQGRFSSGALFVPVQQPGQAMPLWFKVPGQTISELVNGKQIAQHLTDLIVSGNAREISMAQNILGSNALRQTEGKGKGNWAIYPTNQNGGIIAGQPPLTELIDGVWTNDVADIVPNMVVDIAVDVAEGESAFRTNGGLDFTTQSGELMYENLGDFVAREMRLGYAPVVNRDGDVLSWTHPLAPAYSRNDSNPNGDPTLDGKVLYNENANATQLRMGMKVVAVEGVSGKAMLEAITDEEKNEVKQEAAEAAAETPATEEQKDGKIVLTERQKEMAERIRAHKQKMIERNARMGGGLFLTTAAAEASNNSEKSTEIDMKVADEWWAENMGNVPFTRVKGLIKRHGKVGYGIFEQGAVQVSDLAVRGTEYHEAFHAVTHLYLTPERYAKLMKDAERMYGKKSEQALEEDLAEDFREYMLTNGLSNREKSVVRRFFSELLELIRALAKDGFSGARKLYLFQGINRGKFNGSPRVASTAQRWMETEGLPVEYMDTQVREELNAVLKRYGYEAFNMREDLLDETIDRAMNVTEREAKENGYDSKAHYLAESILNLAFDATLAFDITSVQASLDPTSAAHGNVGRLLTNREAIVEAMARDKKFQAWATDLASGTETAGTSATEQYNDDAFAKMPPKESLSANVRNLIETTPQVTAETLRNSAELQNLMAAAEMVTKEAAVAKREGNMTEYARLINQLNEINGEIAGAVGTTTHQSYFGLPRGMNLDLNFAYMSAQLADAATPRDMMNRLYEMGRVYPEFRMLAMRLFTSPQHVQGQFFNGFKRTSTAEVQVKGNRANVQDVFTGTLSFQNQSTILRSLADANLESIGAGIDAAIAKLPELTPNQQVDTVIAAILSTGFNTIDPTALRVVVEMTANNPNGQKELNNMLVKARQVVNTYERLHSEELEEMEYNKRYNAFRDNVNKLSAPFAKYDRAAAQSMIENVEGTRVHNKQVPAFIGRWYADLSARPGESAKAHEARVRKIFEDPRTHATNQYNLIFRNGKFNAAAANRMAAYRVGGMKRGEGKDYGNMSQGEWLAFQVASMFGVGKDGEFIGPMLPITTPSDAGTTYMQPIELFDPSTDAGRTKTLRRLEQIVEAEVMEMKALGQTGGVGRFSNPKVDAMMRTHFKASKQGDFWAITTTAEMKDVVGKAAEALLTDLLAEADALRPGNERFDILREAEQMLKNRPENGYDTLSLLTVNSYIANWSHAVNLAGTPNEFKTSKGALMNTVDMQKRHKHVLSPTVTPSGASNKGTFKSVTMKDVPFDLSKETPALSAWKQYSKVEIADAQTYVTPDMYEAVLIESGDWDPVYGEAFEVLRQGGTLTSEQHNKLMRPFKPFYYHRLINPKTGLLESQQIKNSIIPMIPGISPGHDKLAKWMKDNKIDQVQMGTAHKVGQNKPNVELINKDGEFEVVNFDADSMVYELPMVGYGKQVHNPDHMHSDSSNKMMSQMERISAAAAVRFMGEEGIKIADDFADAMEEMYEEQYNELMSQFNTEDGTFSNEKFGEWLLGELAANDLPQSTLDLIKEGKFTAPQVVGLVRGRLFSAMDNMAKTVRIPGGTGVQISSQFHTNRAERLKGQRLAEDGKTVLPAQIIVSRDFLPKQYRDMSIEEIRESAPEVLEMFTVRIPSESPNSGSVCEVVGFTPDTMDGVIVPDEFVTQMGSDFDVDKLFFFWKDHRNPDAAVNRLYDGLTAPFRDARVLKAIQAPQGFDQLASVAEDKGRRAATDTRFIAENPLSFTAHHFLTGDNKAGINLKGQAANKNLIALDFIRNRFVMKTNFVFGNNVVAGFNWKTISEETVALHAEMVAAAMDGAKDPVFGKLGVTNTNFNLFSTLILLGDNIPSYETAVIDGQTVSRPGSLSFAAEVVQSEPATLIANGDIMLQGGKTTRVTALTDEGIKFVQKLAKGTEHEGKAETMIDLPVGKHSMRLNPRGDVKALTVALGQFQSKVVKPLTEQGDAMRVDRISVNKGAAAAARKSADQYTFSTPDKKGVNPVEEISYAGKDGERTFNPFGARIKGTVRKTFDGTREILSNLGDGYLQLLHTLGQDPNGEALTAGAYDAFIAAKAAEQFGSLQAEYVAMGERSTRGVAKLPENKSQYSLEQWERTLRNSEEAANDPDLALVLDKILVQPNPYQLKSGEYMDNITLMGISDDAELLLVQNAIQRLYDKGGDMKMFIDTMATYEAQRSRFNMSQSRFTSVLPTQVQQEIAKQAGVSMLSDGAGDYTSPQTHVAAMLKNQLNSASSLPVMGLAEGQDLNAALRRAEESPQKGPRRVIVEGEHFALIPMESDVEDGSIEYRAYAIQTVTPGGAMQNFSGKEMNHAFEELIIDVLPPVDEETNESRLEYGKDLRPNEKIAFLKTRFAQAGVPVSVAFDADLGANAQVVINKERALITINPNLLQGDTIAHEFGHVLVEGLGYEHPAVQQAIKELRGTEIWKEVEAAYGDVKAVNKQKFEKEVVVTALGRAATKKMEAGKLRTAINKLMRAIGKLFGIQPKGVAQLVDTLLAEGPIPAFNLAGVNTLEEQRRKKASAESITDQFAHDWGKLTDQMAARRFTNTEFELAYNRMQNKQYRAEKAKTQGSKLAIISDAVTEEINSAAGITTNLMNKLESGFTTQHLTPEEATLLAATHTQLQSLETLRGVLEGMDPEALDANPKVREQYKQLQEQLDQLIRAEMRLKDELTAVISKQLVNNTTDKTIKEFVEKDNNLIFDMINDAEMRKRMTDVTAVEKGTLGIKEFKNPIAQLIAKQIASATEAGRLEGRQAEQRVADILKEAEQNGVKVSDIVGEDGKFIQEYDSEYISQARKVRFSHNEGEYIKFHAANSENEYNKQYMQEFLFGTIGLRKQMAKLEEMKNARKVFGMKSLDGAIEQLEQEVHVMLTSKKGLIEKFNDITVADNFEAARQNEIDKLTAQAQKNDYTDGEVAAFVAEGIKAFDNKHGVIDGVPMNENSRFVTITPKAEFKNENYTGTDGRPVPMAKHRNPKFDKLSAPAKKALSALNEELKSAMGADAKFVEEGSIPYYKVAEEKSLTWRERLSAARKSVEETAGDIKSNNKEKYSELVMEDASGRNIYVRGRKVNALTAEEAGKFESLSDLAKHIGEAVKDAHKESATANVESFGYLSRDVFEGTEVIDGKHSILMGKKGDRSRALRTRSVEGTKIAVALDQWLEGMLGDNWEDSTAWDGAVGAFQQYTSLMGVGLNISAWINNFAYGNVQRWLEVRDNEFYDKEHAKRARSVIGSEIIGITTDVMSGQRSGYSSAVSAVINLMDIADDQRELPFGKRETRTSKAMNWAYVGQTMGEVIMQNHTAIAMMMEVEVTLKDGTKTNLYDAMTGTFKDGMVSLPEGATVTYQGEQVALDTNFLALFRNKAKSVNHYIHGAYNKQDAGTWQREAWGRALMQFRRWLPMNMKKRFASEQYNESREREEIGWYRALGKFMGLIVKDIRSIKDAKNALEAMKQDSPAMYKGIMNAMIEIGSGIGMFLLLALLYMGLDEEDEEMWAVAFTLNRSQRLMQEMNTYTPWGLYTTFAEFGENPLAAIGRMEGFGSLIAQGVEDGAGFVFKGEGMEEYASGAHKGDTKLWRHLWKSVPGSSHYMRLADVPFNQKQYSKARNMADWFKS